MDSEGVIIERLVKLTRYPEPGKTKTRLIPILGTEGAAYTATANYRVYPGSGEKAST